jgi:hypothetical protein
MLKTAQRDLLVVSKTKGQTSNSFQQEIELLEVLLYTVEMAQNVAISTEVLDINRYRTIRKHKEVVRLLLKNENRSFVFFINRN